MSRFIVKDVDGFTRVVDTKEVLAALGDGATIYGMSLKVIAEMRIHYTRRGGLTPITVESVRKVFAD